MPEQSHALKFSIVSGSYAVCQLPADASIPDWLPSSGFISITRAVDELSVVCSSDSVPTDVKAERSWACLELHGPFPFSMTGVLTSFLQPLGNAAVPIFAVSTFNTDYVFVPAKNVDAALQVLQNAGHELVRDPDLRPVKA